MREAERELAERLITAEQDERRLLALFLHDGPVQSLSGIALMLDAARHAIEYGRATDAAQVLETTVDLHRDVIRALRDLSFNLEPIVLRDQGFAPAVQALAEQFGLRHRLQIDVDVEAGERIAEKAQVALYQVIREGLNQAIRRGPPNRISIRIEERRAGGIEAVIEDDGSGERRRASVEAIEERAAALNGRVRVEHADGGGTLVRVVLPAYTTRR